MKRRIEVRMGRTISVGQFESKRIDMGIARDIKDDADLDDEFGEILEYLEEYLDEEEAAILEEATKDG